MIEILAVDGVPVEELARQRDLEAAYSDGKHEVGREGFNEGLKEGLKDGRNNPKV